MTFIELHSKTITYIPELDVLNLRTRFVSFCLFCSILLICLFTTQSFAYETVKFESSKSTKSKKVLLRGNLFVPSGKGPFPAVVLMHGCGGWQTAVHTALSNYATFLTNNGFAVLNLDSFGPRRNSGGEVCASYEKLRDARKYRTVDAFDAIHYLKKLNFIDSNNIFLMGQSNGGSVAINIANSSKTKTGYRAVVAYYPWCGAFGSNKVKLTLPLLVLGGEQDNWVPPQPCKKVVSIGEELRVTIFPKAVHSFDIDIIPQRYMGKLIGYDENAARNSRIAMLSFFNQHLTLDARNNIRNIAQN